MSSLVEKLYLAKIPIKKFHELEAFERECFHCRNPLHLRHYLHENKKIEMKELLKLWERKEIEFFCCTCYKIMM